ncbi:carbamoyltransferase family protein [Halosimplex amylolyticum]|uniref:carbamoyltransferase family protein n=1 Tax=Halosimplex amylolyticum TaxID=3396616 RepID=UPI003F573BDB
MHILGVYPSHDSGAAVIDGDGEILAAINEGRVVGDKLYWGFPTQSIGTALSIAGLDPGDIDAVAFGGRNPAIGKREAFDEIPPKKRLMELFSHAPGTGSKAFSSIGRSLFARLRDDADFESRLERQGIDAPVTYYDHHHCHATAAYYTSPFDEDTLIATVDAQGDFRSAGIYTVDEDGLVTREAWTPFYHSLGKYWSYVTFNLGFTPMRHEGKISGLAAHGDPDVCIDVFRKYMAVDTDDLRLVSSIGCWNNPAAARLHEALRGVHREDIAAALQQRTEEVVGQLVDAAMRRYDCSKLALAGGVFANVGLNQHLLELDSVDDVFIHPHMGDGGLGVGAAYAHWAEQRADVGEEPDPRFIETVYYGTESTDDEIESALQSADLAYESPDDPDAYAGELLAEGYVVGRYAGRLEYGPRALGNRSILAMPTDPSCQDWLNERLDRTEFMPFAPSILASHAEDYFVDTSAGAAAGKFMTLTFDVTDLARETAPATVHIDGTARPQIVERADNPGYHRVLERYEQLSGHPIVLNTSFNAHGQPIVNEPEQAIRAYRSGMIDALAIGDHVVCEDDRTPSIDATPRSEMLDGSPEEARTVQHRS